MSSSILISGKINLVQRALLPFPLSQPKHNGPGGQGLIVSSADASIHKPCPYLNFQVQKEFEANGKHKINCSEIDLQNIWSKHVILTGSKGTITLLKFYSGTSERNAE
jgi:hypothetical protein